ncbi:MAG: glycerophosphodiester phosphodiesterase family protein [Caldilineales bacterium]
MIPTLELPGKAKPYVLAHRGNRVRCPENTLPAFRQALADGADALETDLHLSADGVLMCIHDATVDRTTDGHGAVADMTLAELRGLSAAYGRSEFAAARIPTLAEVAALLPEDVALALELKSDRFLEPAVARQLVDELAAAGVRNRTVVLSFSAARVQAVQAAAPDLPIGLISMGRLWPARGMQLHGLFWPWLLLNPFYAALVRRRGELFAPLDPAPDRRVGWYRRMGCDVILTDDPAATRRALGR